MSVILEIAPHYARTPAEGAIFSSAQWNSADATERIAGDRGHDYRRSTGEIGAAELAEALDSVDALIWAPVTNPQPADETIARAVIARIAEVLDGAAPSLHIVLVSHFLVGHGPTHRNAKVGTWTLQATEEAVRRSRRDWTVVRPTWLAQRGISSYLPSLTQDTLADGLVTVHTVGNAVISSIEQRERSAGVTFAVYDAAIDAGGLTVEPLELAPQLIRDYEYTADVR